MKKEIKSAKPGRPGLEGLSGRNGDGIRADGIKPEALLSLSLSRASSRKNSKKKSSLDVSVNPKVDPRAVDKVKNGSPQIVHVEGKRWIETLGKQAKLKQKAMNHYMDKKRGR